MMPILLAIVTMVHGCSPSKQSQPVTTTVAAPPPAETGPAVRLSVNASTWRKADKPFDVAAIIRPKLMEAGLRLVGSETTAYTYILKVDYSERKGDSFQNQSMSGVGTNITCVIKLCTAAGRVLCHERLTAKSQGNAGLVGLQEGEDPDKQLWEMAHNDLVLNPILKHLDGILAAGLGKGDRCSVLRSSLISDDDDTTRVWAATLLAEAGDKRAIGPMLAALTGDSFFGNEDFRQIRQALRRLGWRPTTAEDTVKCYIGTYGEDAGPVMRLGRNAVPTLLMILRGSTNSWICRMNAATALGDMRARDAIPDLQSALADEDSSVRRESATALGKIGDKKAIPALLALAGGDGGEDVSSAARAAVQLIRKRSGQ